VEIVKETVSGKFSWKKLKLTKVVEELKRGDRLIVSKLSRLGRSMLECMEVLSIAVERGVHDYSVKGNWRLDRSIQSKTLAMAFSMAAETETERELISQRTNEALRAKKAVGVKLRRPKGPGKSKRDTYHPKIEALPANGATQKFVSERYDLTWRLFCLIG